MTRHESRRHESASLETDAKMAPVPDRLPSESLEADLGRFYDQQAPTRAEWELSTERVQERLSFISRLQSERRSTVVEIGAGAGQDVEAFMHAGIDVTAVDLSVRHAELCQQKGGKAMAASMLSLPFGDNTFDAGWSMSALLHVPDSDFSLAVDEIGRCLRPGAPLAIGLWGGRDEEQVLAEDHHQPHRFFAYRSDDRLLSMLAEHGPLLHWTTWSSPFSDTNYQFAVLQLH